MKHLETHQGAGQAARTVSASSLTGLQSLDLELSLAVESGPKQ